MFIFSLNVELYSKDLVVLLKDSNLDINLKIMDSTNDEIKINIDGVMTKGVAVFSNMNVNILGLFYITVECVSEFAVKSITEIFSTYPKYLRLVVENMVIFI